MGVSSRGHGYRFLCMVGGVNDIECDVGASGSGHFGGAQDEKTGTDWLMVRW